MSVRVPPARRVAARQAPPQLPPRPARLARLDSAQQHAGSPKKAAAPAAAGDERYPLVVANILAGTLVELAPLIAARVAAGGTLLLSGIWGEEQATRVTEAYAAQGFGSCESRATNEWTLLTLRA